MSYRTDRTQLTGSARKVVEAYALPALIARRDECAAALSATSDALARVTSRGGWRGRFFGSKAHRARVRELELERARLTNELAMAEASLEAATQSAFESLPPLGVAATSVAVCREARSYLRRPGGHEHNSLAKERALSSSLVSLAQRVLDTWAPWFDPQRFVARLRTAARPEWGTTPALVVDGRLGFRPIGEDDLLRMATSSATSVTGRAVLERAFREADWMSKLGTDGAHAASRLRDHGLLSLVSVYPPLGIWLSATRLVWLLVGLEWPPFELVLRPDGRFTWTTVLALRAWQLSAVRELEDATDDAFRGLPALVGGRVREDGPTAQPKAAYSIGEFAARASLHAAIISDTKSAHEEPPSTVGFWPKSAKSRTASGIIALHRSALASIAAEQANVARRLSSGPAARRIRDHLTGLSLRIEELHTIKEPVSGPNVPAPVFGLEETKTAAALLMRDLRDVHQLYFTPDVLIREGVLGTAPAPLVAGDGRRSFREIAAHLAHILPREELADCARRCPTPFEAPNPILAHDANDRAWRLLITASTDYPPLALYLSSLELGVALNGVHAVVVRRRNSEGMPSYHCELRGVEQAVVVLGRTARAAIAAWGPMTADGELLLAAAG